LLIWKNRVSFCTHKGKPVGLQLNHDHEINPVFTAFVVLFTMKRFRLNPSTHTIIVDFFDGRDMSPGLASKHLEYVRTSKSIAKAMQTQRICRAWGNSFARGFARVILDRVRDNLDQAPGSRNWGSELDADAEFNFYYLPQLEEAVLNGLFS
jgi:hypothetical protein